jgi:hypothetical protein
VGAFCFVNPCAGYLSTTICHIKVRKNDTWLLQNTLDGLVYKGVYLGRSWRCKLNTKLNSGNLKPQLFDLADVDRTAIKIIRELAGLPSDAMAVRMSIRNYARELESEWNTPASKKGIKNQANA